MVSLLLLRWHTFRQSLESLSTVKLNSGDISDPFRHTADNL